jgi:hypothetical protein
MSSKHFDTKIANTKVSVGATALVREICGVIAMRHQNVTAGLLRVNELGHGQQQLIHVRY